MFVIPVLLQADVPSFLISVPVIFIFFHSAVYIFLKHFPLCSGALLNESPGIDAVKWTA